MSLILEPLIRRALSNQINYMRDVSGHYLCPWTVSTATGFCSPDRDATFGRFGLEA